MSDEQAWTNCLYFYSGEYAPGFTENFDRRVYAGIRHSQRRVEDPVTPVMLVTVAVGERISPNYIKDDQQWTNYPITRVEPRLPYRRLLARSTGFWLHAKAAFTFSAAADRLASDGDHYPRLFHGVLRVLGFGSPRTTCIRGVYYQSRQGTGLMGRKGLCNEWCRRRARGAQHYRSLLRRSIR